MVTLDACTVIDPEMFFPSTTAPSVVTVIEPDGARLEQSAPVLVASGKPHACGLATQSVRRVTGLLPVAEGEGMAWAAGCEPGVGLARPAEPPVAGPPPPMWT